MRQTYIIRRMENRLIPQLLIVVILLLIGSYLYIRATSPVEEPKQIFISPTPTMGEADIRVVGLAKENLSQMTGLPIAEITVVKVEKRQWSDSSLGCPKEGQYYLQVITPGYHIELKAGDDRYEYHSDLKDRVVSCP